MTYLGLDIGTSKVVALVGEYAAGSPIEVVGIGTHESRGLKRGVVVALTRPPQGCALRYSPFEHGRAGSCPTPCPQQPQGTRQHTQV